MALITVDKARVKQAGHAVIAGGPKHTFVDGKWVV